MLSLKLQPVTVSVGRRANVNLVQKEVTRLVQVQLWAPSPWDPVSFCIRSWGGYFAIIGMFWTNFFFFIRKGGTFVLSLGRASTWGMCPGFCLFSGFLFSPLSLVGVYRRKSLPGWFPVWTMLYGSRVWSFKLPFIFIAVAIYSIWYLHLFPSHSFLQCMLKTKWNLQRLRQLAFGSMVTKKGDSKNHMPGSGRKGCQVLLSNRTAQCCSFLSAKMKIWSQIMDVFFCHNIFSWSERGFRSMITWLLCRQNSSLYCEAWETETTWTGRTIHKFQVSGCFFFLILFFFFLHLFLLPVSSIWYIG